MSKAAKDELQREFARRVTAQCSSLAALDILLATLQHRAFCGKL